MSEPKYEGTWRRLLAVLLDNAVWLVAVVFIAGLIPADVFDTDIGIVTSVVLFGAWFNYFAVAEWRWGQTIGKSAMSMRVTTESGERPGWNAAALRNLLRLVDVLVIGPVLIALSERRQRLRDRFAHTVVVSTRPEHPPVAYPPPAIPVPPPPRMPPPPPPGTPPPPPPPSVDPPQPV